MLTCTIVKVMVNTNYNKKVKEMKILNLTQHVGTIEQGVIEPEEKERVARLLTFAHIPTKEALTERANLLASLAVGHDAAMIGGAPFFMSHLENALKAVGVTPLYAFSVRESVENSEGKKVSTFKHKGWVNVD